MSTRPRRLTGQQALELAIQRYLSGDHPGAEALLRQLAAKDPDNPSVLNNLGIALRAQGKLQEAIAFYNRAIAADPVHPAARYNLGNALKDIGALDEAVAAYRKAIELKPDYHEAHNSLGFALQGKGDLEAAIPCYRRAVAVKPDYVEALNNLANCLKLAGNNEEAIATYRRALEVRPDYASAWSNLGVTLKEAGRLQEGIAAYRRALEVDPDYAAAHYNLGNALKDAEEVDEAIASYRRAIALEPNYADAHNSLGFALMARRQVKEAVAHYLKALALKPQDALAHTNYALALLVQGDYARGWPEYEWRWKCKELAARERPFPQPRWDGSDPAGRRIFVYAEQGMGDTMHFVRYLPLLARRGATVLLECQEPLVRLLRSVEGIAAISAQGDPVPEFDCHIPLLSLPLAFGTRPETIPAELPYIHAEPERVEKWKARLGDAPGLKAGLVWAGKASYRSDRRRSMSLAAFAPLAGVPGLRLLSLQKGDPAAQLAQPPAGLRLEDFMEEVEDFADTAALIANLDVVVSVDTSVAHLAGALGRPVWLLCRYESEWRWFLDREDSPWYPSMRIFRQPAPFDWAAVMERVAGELRAALADRARLLPPPGAAAPAPAPPPRRAGKGGTDLARWSDPSKLEPAWNERARLAAGFIPAGARVLDLGCGAMALERFLPEGCTYQPCDVVPRDARTLVCDFNAGELPPAGGADILTLLGVLEYIHDLPAFLRALHGYGLPVVASYNPTDRTAQLDRPALGWVNHLSLAELRAVLREAGFGIRAQAQIDRTQMLLRLTPEPLPEAATPSVLVLSYNNAANFGDRLGVHLVNAILPPEAQVSFAHFRPWDVPEQPFDLLVLGIGNSLFGPLLDERLLRLLERIPYSVGVFGTQYRDEFEPARMHAVLDRLGAWHARYEEDALLYGRRRGNVRHLGDWLVNLFPMTRWSKAERLVADASLMKRELPMDRLIQTIQSYREVVSMRLHPLLVALTSAERVAYREQRESGSGKRSGKFRSMLLDVFGRDFQEDKLFDVDREAVLAYKLRCAAGMERLRGDIAQMLARVQGG